MCDFFYTQPVNQLTGIGRSAEETLKKLDIVSMFDLLTHLPIEYQDQTKIASISELILDQPALIIGKIIECHMTQTRKPRLTCLIADRTDQIRLHFFHSYAAQKKQFSLGFYVRCYGIPKLDHQGFIIYHPEYNIHQDKQVLKPQQCFTPVYSSTTGLTQHKLRKWCALALALCDQEMEQTLNLPIEIQKQFNLWPITKAFHYLHNPPATAIVPLTAQHPAKYRLIFDELLAYQLHLNQLKKEYKSKRAPALLHNTWQIEFISTLSFQLTNAQMRVVQEIHQDLLRSTAMLRLLQGDVGSGKTIVAVLAALQCIENGYQAALLAPTELLAEQHYMNCKAWFQALPISINLLTGKLSTANKQACLANIQSGKTQLIIGTHALFQATVKYDDLGLIIIDEQHRFGVNQRRLLLEKAKKGCHQLLMTATPIPRTLAMSLYSHIDLSTIDELPDGRIPIMTSVMPDKHRQDLLSRVQKICLSGQQVYWICSWIDTEDPLHFVQAAELTKQKLSEHFPNLQIGLLHGRLDSSEKHKTMSRFKAGEIHILVATTVIEVGIDVPNASIIIIENADRLGLAQLHQLRGRVGRGSLSSYCILLYQESISHIGIEKLKAMKQFKDGFLIAEKDLTLRGGGDVNGIQQTGNQPFKIANLSRDQVVLPDIVQAADIIDKQYPEYIEPLIDRWSFLNQMNYSHL
ncbi:MAG: ATP-dependent DNA helicase RecG [Endozoicomonadaceae bacterium]|nr:ATP-dependent DNA helicase RecG [Endozoicomonadaceae bacterium]